MRDKILHLNLYKEFFDKIISGKKTKEYRDKTDYWKKRLLFEDSFRKFDYIIFRNGYSKSALEIKIVCKKIYQNQNEFVIVLGKIIYVKNLTNQFNKKRNYV